MNGDVLGVAGAGSDGFLCFLGLPSAKLRIVEFYNTNLAHYFMTDDVDEIAAIERGDAGPGWIRTGETISGHVAIACSDHATPNPTPLYRFYGRPGLGPNSHFLTADRQECGAVRNDPGWRFEAAPFRVWAPSDGRCPAGSSAVFRLYNDRAAQNDSNHRYTVKTTIVDAMRAHGWRFEGTAFCVPQ